MLAATAYTIVRTVMAGTVSDTCTVRRKGRSENCRFGSERFEEMNALKK